MIQNCSQQTFNNTLSNSRPKILVIEDDPMLQSSYALLLQGAGYNFHISASGKEAINAFLSYDFDLILLDIKLPDMSGIEVNNIIRSCKLGKNIPIIAFTALGNEIQKDCLESGINHVVLKPTSTRTLINIFEQVVA